MPQTAPSRPAPSPPAWSEWRDRVTPDLACPSPYPFCHHLPGCPRAGESISLGPAPSRPTPYTLCNWPTGRQPRTPIGWPVRTPQLPARMASRQSRSSAHPDVRLEAGPRQTTRELHPAELVLMLVQPTESGFGGSHPAGSWEIGKFPIIVLRGFTLGTGSLAPFFWRRGFVRYSSTL